MTPIPKPPKRQPRPRKCIARRAPVPRVSAKGRRCRTTRELLELRRDTRTANRLWSFLIEQDQGPLCQWYGVHGEIGCDAHHLREKGAHPATRWDLENGAWLSRPAHERMGQDKAANLYLALQLLGAERWEWLCARSVADVRERPADAVARLRAEVERRGLTAKARERGLWEDK
jgi:hypothetical protein